MAAISKVLASLVGTAVAACARGPVRPRGLFAIRRLSRTLSNSIVFGGSCFVASAAAYKNVNNDCGVECKELTMAAAQIFNFLLLSPMWLAFGEI